MRLARYSPPLPETIPDADTWAGLLWPWLDRIDTERPHCAVVARNLAYGVDGRDRTVDTTRSRVATRHDLARVVAELVDHGMLEPASPGRHRVVLPEPERLHPRGHTRR
jgi:hypothetical protein